MTRRQAYPGPRGGKRYGKQEKTNKLKANARAAVSDRKGRGKSPVTKTTRTDAEREMFEKLIEREGQTPCEKCHCSGCGSDRWVQPGREPEPCKTCGGQKVEGRQKPRKKFDEAPAWVRILADLQKSGTPVPRRKDGEDERGYAKRIVKLAKMPLYNTVEYADVVCGRCHKVNRILAGTETRTPCKQCRYVLRAGEE